MSRTIERPVTTRIIDEALEIGATVYHEHTLQIAERDRFGMRLRAGVVGPLVVGTLEYATAVRIDAAPFEDSYQVNFPLFGRILVSEGGRVREANERTAVVHGPAASTAIMGWDAPTRMLGVKVGRLQLEAALSTLIGREVERPIDFTRPIDLQTAIGADWARLCRRLGWWAFARKHAETQLRDDTDDALLVERTLVEAALHTLLTAAEHDQSGPMLRTASGAPSAALRALAIMHARPGPSTTVAGIAAEVGIGVRALELNFQERWGRSPSRLLREIRLGYARQELLSTTRESVHIAEVAARWGHGHPGRFSLRYTERFGESPSSTRARAVREDRDAEGTS